MSRRLAPLTLDNLGDLPRAARTCVAWELDPVAARRAREVGDTAFEKEAWLSATLLEWGSCGRLVYVDDRPAGFAMYAPPAFVPRSVAFPTSPVSADAVLLMSLMIEPSYREVGLARMLIQAAAKDLTRRNVRALEAFALNVETEPAAQGDRAECLLPAEMLLAVGFKTVRQHHRFPRLRLELKNAVSWREDVEAALERILGTVRAPALSSSAHESDW
jgi:GNAT superfamily N-acetyltransferase